MAVEEHLEPSLDDESSAIIAKFYSGEYTINPSATLPSAKQVLIYAVVT